MTEQLIPFDPIATGIYNRMVLTAQGGGRWCVNFWHGKGGQIHLELENVHTGACAWIGHAALLDKLREGRLTPEGHGWIPGPKYRKWADGQGSSEEVEELKEAA